METNIRCPEKKSLQNNKVVYDLDIFIDKNFINPLLGEQIHLFLDKSQVRPTATFAHDISPKPENYIMDPEKKYKDESTNFVNNFIFKDDIIKSKFIGLFYKNLNYAFQRYIDKVNRTNKYGVKLNYL